MGCAYCGSHTGMTPSASYGLCPGCHALLEVELTGVAVQVAGAAPPDAVTLPDFVLPEGWVAPAASSGALPSAPP